MEKKQAKRPSHLVTGAQISAFHQMQFPLHGLFSCFPLFFIFFIF